eukprot:8182680-Karenia_brevis.AAC.1
MLYATTSWTLTVARSSLIRSAQRRMVRTILGCGRKVKEASESSSSSASTASSESQEVVETW